MKTMLDIPYSERDELTKLDLFLPEANANGCCLFCVHGGGWSGGNRQSWHAVAKHFCELGYVAVSAGYRLVPAAIFPAQIGDVRLAMSYVRSRAEEFPFSPSRIAAMGSSAGGHLVALLGTIGEDDELGATPDLLARDTRPNAIVPYCPVTTLCADRCQNGKLNDSHVKLMGSAESEAADQYRQASPLHRVTGDEPPYLFIHGDADETVPLSHSQEMSRQLTEAGVRSEVAVLPGVGHGFGYGVPTDAQKKAIALMAAFLADCFGLNAA